MEIILASNSSRRKELLTEYGYKFTVTPPTGKEVLNGESAKDAVKKLSLEKAENVYNRLNKKSGVLVIGADTVVEYNGRIIGKPQTEKDAERILKELSGNTHNVYTGIAVIFGDIIINEAVKSEVEFNILTAEFIKKYIESGSPMDKAGAYGIQDGAIVKSYNGSYTNIVGLPMERLTEILKDIIKPDRGAKNVYK